MFKHILVPTDGSQLAQVAVDKAIEFATEIGANVTFCCVEHPSPNVYLGWGAINSPTAPREYAEREAENANTVLERCTQRAAESGVTSDRIALISPEPYEAIIEAADRCAADVIFMASHGYSGVRSWVLGSQTQKVLSHSTIPVLVYR